MPSDGRAMTDPTNGCSLACPIVRGVFEDDPVRMHGGIVAVLELCAEEPVRDRVFRFAMDNLAESAQRRLLCDAIRRHRVLYAG